MTAITPEEKRALSQDELELSHNARQPRLAELTDAEVADLISRLRDRRNRARDIGNRQRREARGKAEPAGTSPASDDSGTRSKQDYLTAALRRATSEQKKRERSRDGGKQVQTMTEDGGPLHPTDVDADPGKAPLQATGLSLIHI